MYGAPLKKTLRLRRARPVPYHISYGAASAAQAYFLLWAASAA
jgi:hypothetical protein